MQFEPPHLPVAALRSPFVVAPGDGDEDEDDDNNDNDNDHESHETPAWPLASSVGVVGAVGLVAAFVGGPVVATLFVVAAGAMAGVVLWRERRRAPRPTHADEGIPPRIINDLARVVGGAVIVVSVVVGATAVWLCVSILDALAHLDLTNWGPC